MWRSTSSHWHVVKVDHYSLDTHRERQLVSFQTSDVIITHTRTHQQRRRRRRRLVVLSCTRCLHRSALPSTRGIYFLLRIRWGTGDQHERAANCAAGVFQRCTTRTHAAAEAVISAYSNGSDYLPVPVATPTRDEHRPTARPAGDARQTDEVHRAVQSSTIHSPCRSRFIPPSTCSTCATRNVRTWCQRSNKVNWNDTFYTLCACKDNIRDELVAGLYIITTNTVFIHTP